MALDGYVNSDMVVNTAKRIDVLSSQLYVQSKSFDEIYEMAKNKNEMLACIPAIMPVKDTDIYRISSHYGQRTDPFYKVTKFHGGIDFSGPLGTGIYATGDGTVIRVEKNKSGYGNNVLIDHGYGYKTRYAHLDSFSVKKGDKVKRGQEIGKMGNTGKSTAPHLHYEVIKNNKTVNPINFFYNDTHQQPTDAHVGGRGYGCQLHHRRACGACAAQQEGAQLLRHCRHRLLGRWYRVATPRRWQWPHIGREARGVYAHSQGHTSSSRRHPRECLSTHTSYYTRGSSPRLRAARRCTTP